jgi:hypothetical protein
MSSRLTSSGLYVDKRRRFSSVKACKLLEGRLVSEQTMYPAVTTGFLAQDKPTVLYYGAIYGHLLEL